MAGEPRQRETVECRTPQGKLLATVEIYAPAASEGQTADMHPLVLLTSEEARQYSEERLQLRERGRYEYRLTPAPGAESDLMLLPQRGVQPSQVGSGGGDRGLIEPQDQCGLFPLTVIRRGGKDERPLAYGVVEVRSLKLGYREHYRGMLSYIADKSAGLLLDCRAPTQLRLATLWRTRPRILEQQLEFLRHILEGAVFRAAVDEVLRNPHRRLEDEREQRDIARPLKPGRDFARQVGLAGRRVAVPASHPLYATVPSLPAQISARTRTDFLDTAENRFAKMVLAEFRDFLADVDSYLGRVAAGSETPETQRLRRETRRLRGMLETQLARGFFPDVSPPSVLPLGSPALQRKAGYRELFRFWLQFHAGAQLAWDGGADVFEASSRNVATLYEYWLFFQLEALFRQRFNCEQPLHMLLVDRKQAPAQLVLRRGVQLESPVAGAWAKTAGRHLRAEFQFNRKFTRDADPHRIGSWTRGVQPDYTISIWPSEYSKDEAERNELMIHVHFDAKYRVEKARELLGDKSDDEAFMAGAEAKDEARTTAKYGDLLKMHAYRDAVRRTAGAYVLYPGEPGDGRMYQGFHEVLPGLGAFAIRPDKDGKPEGMPALSAFLDEVIEHLANRTTSRERVTYHIAETYRIREEPVPYSTVHLAETDIYGKGYRALPPEEHFVLVAWNNDEKQLVWTEEEGVAIVRLGKRPGAWHIQPEFAEARHLLLHGHGGVSTPGLWKLTSPGYRVYTAAELTDRKYPGLAGGEIYALFEVARDPEWAAVTWDSKRLLRAIRDFESSIRHKQVHNIGRRSAYPRILPLRELLDARI
jgi:hypothetical protein